jgi:hypothetical protein
MGGYLYRDGWLHCKESGISITLRVLKLEKDNLESVAQYSILWREMGGEIIEVWVATCRL